jgi:anti-sigma factor RsiW
MTVIEDMTCKELVELVTDYLEGRLSEDESARFEAHLDECQACVNYLDQMRHTISTFGFFPPDSLTPEMQETLLGEFRRWKKTRSS